MAGSARNTGPHRAVARVLLVSLVGALVIGIPAASGEKVRKKHKKPAMSYEETSGNKEFQQVFAKAADANAKKDFQSAKVFTEQALALANRGGNAASEVESGSALTAMLRNQLAEINLGMGLVDTALKNYKQAVKVGMAARRITENMEPDLLDDEEPDAASQELVKKRSKLEKAELFTAHRALGLINRESSRFEDATQHFEAGIEFAENGQQRAEMCKEAGFLHMRQGSYEAARVLLKKAAKLAPRMHKVFANLAICEHQLGLLDDAEESFDKAIELDPDNPNARTNMATLLVQLKRYTDARRYLEKALELDPKHADAMEKIKLLTKMEAEGVLEQEERSSWEDEDPRFKSKMARVGHVRM